MQQFAKGNRNQPVKLWTHRPASFSTITILFQTIFQEVSFPLKMNDQYNPSKKLFQHQFLTDAQYHLIFCV